MKPLPSPRSAVDAWPIGKKLRLYFDKQLRRSHRLFRTFPGLPYRVVMDVGAYEGEFTEQAWCYFQPERIYLVEADPEMAKGLQQKFAARPQCQMIHAAVHKVSGTAEFRVNQHRPSSSLLPISPVSARVFQKEMAETRTFSVPALSLDDLFARENIEVVDLMKVDIQGAERMLIQGGRAALKRVRVIYIEVLFEECYQGCALFCELHELLGQSGFKLRSLHDFRRGHDGNLVYANGLYQRAVGG